MYSNLTDDEIFELLATIKLTPSYHGQACIAHGEHLCVECCCDACDFFLICFPEYDTR